MRKRTAPTARRRAYCAANRGRMRIVPVPAPEVSAENAAAFARAVDLMSEGRNDEALAPLLTVTRAQPELAGPWVNLGNVYISLERFEEARSAFEHALDANPGSCEAYNQLGVLSRKHGDFERAEALYRSCLEVAPDFKDTYLNLGILYELYLGKWDAALTSYRRYLDLSEEDDRRVRGWVADLERRIGR